MTINAFKVINGTLTLGAGPLAASGQVLSCTLVPSEKVKETDPEPVLSGEELPGSSSSSVTWRLKFKVFQDLRSTGIVAYSFTHSGESVAFAFTPTDEEDHAASFTGDVFVVPIQVGGDVSKTDRAKSDADWRVDGNPTPTWPS